MTDNKKPTYTKPSIIPLGELARGLGAPCAIGSVATGQCGPGPSVPPLIPCSTGGQAGAECTNGPSANTCSGGARQV